MAFVFAAIALSPNGVMDVKVALSVTFAMSLVGSACAIITFAILQGYTLNEGRTGMPRECGYLLGGFVAESVGAGASFFAWLPYHVTPVVSQEDQLWESQRELEIEQIRLETIRVRAERLRLEAAVAALDGTKVDDVLEEEKVADSPTMMITATDLQAV